MNSKSETVATHFGNIIPTGLSTKTPLLTGFTPIQRIFLTASGTLQQILSAFHNTPVTVQVLKNQFTSTSKNNEMDYYDRCVSLRNESGVLCIAQSKVYCISQESKDAVKSGGIGIGQLFKYFGVIPEFVLVECGVHDESFVIDSLGDRIDKTVNYCEDRLGDGLRVVFWRRYELKSKYLRCEIFEQFLHRCDQPT